jgi:hypothetical protein
MQQLKMRFLFTAWFISLFFLSCSNDSDDSDQGLTQDQLSAVSGLYNLTEHLVNPPQDLNGDDIRSQDLMTELDCLSANIIFREDQTYSKFYVELSTSFITNDQYAIFCRDNRTSSGTWDLVNGQIILSEETQRNYSLEGSILRCTEGLDLPGFRTQVYVKQ